MIYIYGLKRFIKIKFLKKSTQFLNVKIDLKISINLKIKDLNFGKVFEKAWGFDNGMQF